MQLASEVQGIAAATYIHSRCSVCTRVGAVRHALCLRCVLGRLYACLTHLFWGRCRRRLLVRIEELLGDFERAELIASEDLVVLNSRLV